MGNRLIKYHLNFYVPKYMLGWGPMAAFDSSIMERSHKREAKHLARLTDILFGRPSECHSSTCTLFIFSSFSGLATMLDYKQDWRLYKRLKYALKGEYLVTMKVVLCESYGNLGPEIGKFHEGKLRI